MSKMLIADSKFQEIFSFEKSTLERRILSSNLHGHAITMLLDHMDLRKEISFEFESEKVKAVTIGNKTFDQKSGCFAFLFLRRVWRWCAGLFRMNNDKDQLKARRLAEAFNLAHQKAPAPELPPIAVPNPPSTLPPHLGLPNPVPQPDPIPPSDPIIPPSQPPALPPRLSQPVNPQPILKPVPTILPELKAEIIEKLQDEHQFADFRIPESGRHDPDINIAYVNACIKFERMDLLTSHFKNDISLYFSLPEDLQTQEKVAIAAVNTGPIKVQPFLDKFHNSLKDNKKVVLALMRIMKPENLMGSIYHGFASAKMQLDRSIALFYVKNTPFFTAKKLSEMQTNPVIALVLLQQNKIGFSQLLDHLKKDQDIIDEIVLKKMQDKQLGEDAIFIKEALKRHPFEKIAEICKPAALLPYADTNDRIVSLLKKDKHLFQNLAEEKQRDKALVLTIIENQMDLLSWFGEAANDEDVILALFEQFGERIFKLLDYRYYLDKPKLNQNKKFLSELVRNKAGIYLLLPEKVIQENAEEQAFKEAKEVSPDEIIRSLGALSVITYEALQQHRSLVFAAVKAAPYIEVKLSQAAQARYLEDEVRSSGTRK